MSRGNGKTSILQRKGLAGRLISVLLIMTMVLAMTPSAVWAEDVLAETNDAAQVETEPLAGGSKVNSYFGSSGAYSIYANGTPLILVQGTGGTDFTVIYEDLDNNGEITEGDRIYAPTGLKKTEEGNKYPDGCYIFGGCENGSESPSGTDSTSVTMKGGKVTAIYGGCEMGTVNGDTNVTITGGTVSDVYGGGGTQDSYVTGSTNVIITGGKIGSDALSGDSPEGVYGGGYHGMVYGSTNVSVKGTAQVSYVCGGSRGGNGGNTGEITRSTHVTIDGDAQVNEVVGGSYNGGTVGGDTEVHIKGGIITDSVYGSSLQGQVRGTVRIVMEGGSVTKRLCGTMNSTVSVQNGVSISITGGSVGKYVWAKGGGFVSGNISLTIGGTAKIGTESATDSDNGIILNCNDSTNTSGEKNGVNKFTIAENHLSEGAKVFVCLPKGYVCDENPVIATNGSRSDLSFIELTGNVTVPEEMGVCLSNDTKNIYIGVQTKDVAAVTIGGKTKIYSYSQTGEYATDDAALRAAWNDAATKSDDNTPATLTLLTSVDLGNETLALNQTGSNLCLTMENGVTLSGSGDSVINVTEGTLRIEKGEIQNSAGAAISAEDQGNVELFGGTFTGGTASVKTAGSKKVSELLATGYGFYYTKDGSEQEVEGEVLNGNSLDGNAGYGTVTVKKNPVAVATVEIAGNTMIYSCSENGEYATDDAALRAAWNYAAENSNDTTQATLTLLTSVDLEKSKSIVMTSGNITLKMAEGIKLVGSHEGVNNNAAIMLKGGRLVMQSGTITYSGIRGVGILIDDYSSSDHCTFIMNGGEIIATGTSATGIKTNYCANGAEITITGESKVYGTGTGITVSNSRDLGDVEISVNISGSAQVLGTEKDSQGLSVGSFAKKTTVTISSGTVCGGPGPNGNGIELNAGNVSMTDGTVSGIRMTDENSEVKISGGKITGRIYVQKGNVILSDCEIKTASDKEGIDVSNPWYSSDGIGGTVNINENVRIVYGGGNNCCGIYVGAGGTVNIKPQVTVESTSEKGWRGVYVVQNGTANIFGGSFAGSSNGLYNSGGTVNLSGGTFTGGVAAISNTEAVKNLLASGCQYFDGTSMASTTKITNETVLGGASLTAADEHGTVTVGKETAIITKQPEGATLQVNYADGDCPKLTVNANATSGETAALTYQWYQKNPEGEDTAIEGATSADYTVPTGLSAGNHEFYCIVTCGDYSAVSETATVTVTKQDGTVTITNADQLNKTYDGEAVAVQYTATGTVTVKYKEKDAPDNAYTTTAPVNAGRYTVRATSAENSNYTAAVETRDFVISPKELTVNVKVNDKEYDGLNTATIQNAELVGVVAADAGKITLNEGTPTFGSAGIGEQDITFTTGFSLNGNDKGNYTLIQPTDVTAAIIAYQAVKDRDYTVNSNDWLSEDFVVTACEGYQVSMTNAADGTWENSLTVSGETGSGSLTFYVKKNSGAISEAVTEEYKIDKTVPTLTVAGNTTSIQQKDTVTLTVAAGPSGIVKVEAKKNEGAYTDITERYANGYEVTENGTYTFRITNGAGVTTEESITYSNLDNTEPVIKIDAVTESGDTYSGDTWTNGKITLSVENTAENLGDTTLSYKIDDGTWQPYTDGLVIDKEGEATCTFKAVSASGIESEKTIVVKRDTASPTGTVAIGEDPTNTWTELKTGITFDQTFNEKQSVTLAGEDGLSGVESVEYFLADKELSADELSAVKWTKYDDPFFIEKSGKYVVYVKITDKAGNEALINSNGIVIDIPFSGSYPVAQKPVIETDGGAEVKLNSTGTTAEITVKDGFEIKKITVNGTPVEVTTKLTGLKTGDKVVITTAPKTEPADPSDKTGRIIKGVQDTYIKIYSLSKGKASRGKGWIRIWYKKSPGYKVDYYEVFRSKGDKKHFGKTAFYKTKKNGLTGWYKNTKNVKKGNRYYYKIRGVRVIDGKKYYTKWSNTIYRTGI